MIIINVACLLKIHPRIWPKNCDKTAQTQNNRGSNERNIFPTQKSQHAPTTKQNHQTKKDRNTGYRKKTPLYKSESPSTHPRIKLILTDMAEKLRQDRVNTKKTEGRVSEKFYQHKNRKTCLFQNRLQSVTIPIDTSSTHPSSIRRKNSLSNIFRQEPKTSRTGETIWTIENRQRSPLQRRSA